ncbi:hypothetical protein Sango_1178100 [Sesamum angolense]|uniref:Uncharacterized protein n=1 Tax=Sesamum angolense TaxID=2727404 RepID=A0AAE1WW41_9LAMI|nr:hypothetical protein Sango_1178100 [Sesamum angolense]
MLAPRYMRNLPSMPMPLAVFLCNNKRDIKRAMCNLGAFNNVMPLTIFKSLNVGSLKDTGIVIQLANRSIVYPEGVLEDVLVQVNELVFPAPFFVIDMREDNSPNSTSILLGRPFLKIARTKLDVHNGTLTIEFHGEAPTLELKELPNYLKYAFLGENDTLPVIISSKLFALEDEKLIRVLQEFHETIGWTMADIKELSPSTCMHRILLEEGGKPSREAQRRLNPPIMEAIKKEIFKLLDAALKYLMPKKDVKPKLIRWILLLQEFDFTIKDEKWAENLDHLNQLIAKGD